MSVFLPEAGRLLCHRRAAKHGAGLPALSSQRAASALAQEGIALSSRACARLRECNDRHFQEGTTVSAVCTGVRPRPGVATGSLRVFCASSDSSPGQEERLAAQRGTEAPGTAHASPPSQNRGRRPAGVWARGPGAEDSGTTRTKGSTEEAGLRAPRGKPQGWIRARRASAPHTHEPHRPPRTLPTWPGGSPAVPVQFGNT